MNRLQCPCSCTAQGRRSWLSSIKYTKTRYFINCIQLYFVRLTSTGLFVYIFGNPGLTLWSILYLEPDLCIPRNETERPHSQFLHSYFCKWIYRFPGSVCLFGCSKIGRLIQGIYKSLTDWEAEQYISALEIRRSRSFISWKT